MADLHIARVCHCGLASGVSEDKRVVRFFWTVLATANATSIAGNAMHAALNAVAVPAAVAAAVATAPPLVLLTSTEAVSLLIRVRRHGSAAYWCALAMTMLLAACVFVLSFDALRDLVIRCGAAPTSPNRRQCANSSGDGFSVAGPGFRGGRLQ